MPLSTVPETIGAIADVEAGNARDNPLRQRALRARMVLLVGASCGLDTLLLALFAWAGLGSLVVPAAYALLSGLCWILFYRLLGSGWSERFRDPYLTVPMMLSAAALELVFSALWPELAFYFVTLLFIVFAFGALRLGWRVTLLTWLGVSVAAGVVVHGLGERLTLPGEDPLQLGLTWLALMLTILRCTTVGLYGNAVREKLTLRNQQLAAASAQIEHLASYDALTGALNRRPLWLRLEQQARRTTAALQGFGVAMLDLDHFKQINDRYGHAVGDEVLKTFADVVRRNLRSGDLLGRYGGEEFILLLGNAPAGSGAAMLERVRQAVAGHDWNALAPGLRVTVSIGLAVFDPSETVEELVKRADHALYRAKHAGRDQVVAAPAQNA